MGLVCVAISLAGLTIAWAEDPSALPLALTPAGQGPITVGPPESLSAAPRGSQALTSAEATDRQPAAGEAPVSAVGSRWRPPLEVRLVPATSANPSASTGQAARPLAPRRNPARSRPPVAGSIPSISAARPASLVAGSLAAVLGVLALFVWCTRRFAPPGLASLPKEVLEPLGRAVLPGQQAVQLVRLGPKLLLIGQHEGSLATLAEITEPTEVEHLLTLCRRQRPDSASTAFAQVLSHLAQGDGTAGQGGPRMLQRGGR